MLEARLGRAVPFEEALNLLFEEGELMEKEQVWTAGLQSQKRCQKLPASTQMLLLFKELLPVFNTEPEWNGYAGYIPAVWACHHSWRSGT